MKDLYEAVIPAVDIWDTNIITKYPDNMRGYVAYDNDNNIVACSVICNLRFTQAMYIDCFTICQSIRGNGYSYLAWNSFLEFIKNDWDINTNCFIIDVYPQNVKIWRKIMGIEILNIDDKVVKPNIISETVTMGKGIWSIYDSISIYSDWQNFAFSW